MTVHCLVCKEQFNVPSHALDREVLVTCPECGFLGHWSSQVLSVPTHQEETELERLEGQPATPSEVGPAGAGDSTVVEQDRSNLPLPYKRRLILKIHTGSRAGEVVVLDSGRAVIGRQDAEIELDDPKLSRKHAVIEAISRENIFLRDLASTNGTLLNGTPVSSKKLRSGDVIQVGGTEIEFLWEDER